MTNKNMLEEFKGKDLETISAKLTRRLVLDSGTVIKYIGQRGIFFGQILGDYTITNLDTRCHFNFYQGSIVFMENLLRDGFVVQNTVGYGASTVRFAIPSDYELLWYEDQKTI